MMRDDFAAFILTHKRPDRQKTLNLLQRAGYTGKVFLVVDDEDPTLDEYKRLYGDRVVVFSKDAGRAITDDADNHPKGRSVVYARNMCWDIARSLGVRYFIQLDDDYQGIEIRQKSDLSQCSARPYGYADDIFSALIEWLECDPRILSVAMAQGGDLIGGPNKSKGVWSRRKAMNTFVCATDRPFKFRGRLNDDVNTYVALGRRGHIFLTTMQALMHQPRTQSAPGGLTEVYLESGTYAKSFMSVMWEPSCVKISVLGGPCKGKPGYWRIHHYIDGPKAYPCILPERYRKP